MQSRLTRWSKAKPKIEPLNRISIFDQKRKSAGIKAQVGIEKSYANADSYWKQAAKEAVLYCAQTHREFTTDMVWEVLDQRGIYTGENRALGAIVQGAHRSGMIQKTGQYKESYRRHNAPIPIWHSNLYGKVKK